MIRHFFEGMASGVLTVGGILLWTALGLGLWCLLF